MRDYDWLEHEYALRVYVRLCYDCNFVTAIFVGSVIVLRLFVGLTNSLSFCLFDFRLCAKR